MSRTNRLFSRQTQEIFISLSTYLINNKISNLLGIKFIRKNVFNDIMLFNKLKKHCLSSLLAKNSFVDIILSNYQIHSANS